MAPRRPLQLLAAVGLQLGLAAGGPAPWPPTFHATLRQNRSGQLAAVDLYYEWPTRNANLIRAAETGELLYDLEYNNRTSFYFTRGPGAHCKTIRFEVGILRPDFMADAHLSGRGVEVDGVPCDVWTKADFITYYEDPATGRPTRWDFFDGARFDVAAWAVNETLPDRKWQAPALCFEGEQVLTGSGVA